MLDAHPEISNPGEANWLFDNIIRHSKSDEWFFNLEALDGDLVFQELKLNIPRVHCVRAVVENFVEQLGKRSLGALVLNVHRNLGKIATLFPKSKLIHIVRDPRDVAMSCIRMGWAGNAYFGVDAWVATEHEWDAFSSEFDNAKILQVRFRDLISNPVLVLTETCKFLRIEFSEAMLSYPKRSTYASPDPSFIEMWRTNLSVREVALAEIKAAQLLTWRDYELSGYPMYPANRMELAYLWVQDRLYRWWFCPPLWSFNVLMEKISRRFFPPLHKKFMSRINNSTRGYLR